MEPAQREDARKHNAAMELSKAIVTAAMAAHDSPRPKLTSMNDGHDKLGQMEENMEEGQTFAVCQPIVVGPKNANPTAAAAAVPRTCAQWCGEQASTRLCRQRKIWG